ncbi:MAG: hypothetical protein GC185_09190 [Alphaproteobacteria bacterium]|nr:hypothetical protein [Alphaproteobacteria bacterium]
MMSFPFVKPLLLKKTTPPWRLFSGAVNPAEYSGAGNPWSNTTKTLFQEIVIALSCAVAAFLVPLDSKRYALQRVILRTRDITYQNHQNVTSELFGGGLFGFSRPSRPCPWPSLCKKRLVFPLWIASATILAIETGPPSE